MSKRERLLEIAEWHRQEASKHLGLARTLKRNKKAFNAAIALADKHGEAASVLRHVAEEQSSTLTFREQVREDRVLCGAPVIGPTFAICIRDRGHAGAHRSSRSV